jgi:hypothetical protein
LLAQVAEAARPWHEDPEVRESSLAKAERVVEEELRRMGWTPPHLEALRKGNLRKVAIVQRLRRETTVSLAWIAKGLRMGAPNHLACLLQRAKRSAMNGAKSEDTLFRPRHDPERSGGLGHRLEPGLFRQSEHLPRPLSHLHPVTARFMAPAYFGLWQLPAGAKRQEPGKRGPKPGPISAAIGTGPLRPQER